MKWGITSTLAYLPGGRILHKKMLRRFGELASISASTRFANTEILLDMARRWCNGVDKQRVVELGTGWVPAVPTGFALAGAQVETFDIVPLVTDEIFCETRQLYAGRTKALSVASGTPENTIHQRLQQIEKATDFAAAAAVAKAGGSLLDLNEDASDEMRIEQEDLGNRNTVSERALGLRKTDLYNEDKVSGVKTDYSRPAPGSSTKFKRAYRDAPPMIPHSVDGLLPITRENNQCLGCHLPEVAKSMGATPIPPTHFTNYRPTTIMKDGKVIKEGKVVGTDLKNTSDIKLAKAQKLDTLYQGRFNCTQCHAPQAKVKTDVANVFRPDYSDDKYKAHSSLLENMNEGVE